ncbi:MAG: CDP-alcohol phosphatidyltransferase family protein, partial [Propylenella sp.]
MTIPNFITIARLIGVPLIVWLMIADRFVEATALFVVAGISDAVDGFIAKRFGAASQLGAYLDPIADKALLVSIYVTLGLADHLPVWLVIAVVSRDILIVGAVVLSW